MKKKIFLLFAFVSFLIFTSFSQEAYAPAENSNPKASPATPLFQVSAGMVYSGIDLSRYISSISYKGFHGRIVTHLGGMFFLSTEYSSFKPHNSPSAWKNIHTRKFDFNGHVSFATNNNLTRIFVLTGANRHEWKATRTGYTDLSQLGSGIPEGDIVTVKRWGVNFGCGFTQTLYENIGIFGDYRFCFGNANNFEKVRIMDVMTTLGLNVTFPHPNKTKGKKSFSIGPRIYKWTHKGA